MLDLKGVSLLFLDIDGVLAIPRFSVNYQGTELKCGMPDSDWFYRCNMHDDVYKDCGVPIEVARVLQKAQTRGTRFYALTQETNSGAYFNKVSFLTNRYSGYFDSYKKVLFVSSPTDKVKMMDVYCQKFALSKNKVMLIDDSYDICLQVSNAGYLATHISELLTT